MALKIGKNDHFERIYMAKFRALAAEFGEFVEYERDRAGRDIGLHFVSKTADGGEIVSPSLVWFQMKGVQADTLSEEQFAACDRLGISLKLGHLRFWYIAPEPTYLALYIEAVDKFFVLNIQKYVTDNYGDDILTHAQKTLTVYVSKNSELDAQAFYLIKRRRSAAAWRDKIAEGKQHANIFFRDAELIRRLSTIVDRNVTINFILRKYMSKLRSEAYFVEAADDSDEEPVVIREHWQYMMPDDLSWSFPYLEFNPYGEDDELEDAFWDDDENGDWPPLELPNGKEVYPDSGFEIVEYVMSVTLNDIGKAWEQTLCVMEYAGFIELNDTGASYVSVAPWHGRDV